MAASDDEARDSVAESRESIAESTPTTRFYLVGANMSLEGAMRGYDAMEARGRGASIDDLLKITVARSLCGILTCLANLEDLIREDIAKGD